MAKVNLDALIPREDFEVTDVEEPDRGGKTATIQIRDLEKASFFFNIIRKPDFQRETNEWEPKRVFALIESFVDGDLIPAIILWRNVGSYTFVLDGSHRLSALASWVNDDYGDKEISKKFYDGMIPEDQIRIAEETRTLIRKRIGPYSDYKLALEHPEKVQEQIKKRAKNLGTLALQLQWVEGDADKAEASFFKINQSAATINNTEIYLLQKRKKPSGLTARAIVRSGTGHKYWSKFNDEIRAEVEEIAKEINDVLFVPPLKNPIKTLDLPIGGKIFSTYTLSLILDFVNIANNVEREDESLLEDIDGNHTIEFLKNCRKIARRINSNHPSSLGLHPAVYFYSRDGRYKTASFYAIVSLMMEFEKPELINDFISIREKFEEFLIEYDFFIQQIVRKYRSAYGSRKFVKDFYLELIKKFKEGKSKDVIVKEITDDNSKFKYLTTQLDKKETSGSEFTREIKSEVFLTEALKSALKCKICNGYIHSHSIQIDHKQRKSEGGLGNLENAQLSHPYCNTTYKH